ncbi:TonB family protein [Rhodoferax sp.]|uniref:energy transducer TonB n=1 Tax=Rhodoferax sp. TaxID=50421 RepID=UPI00283AC24B|nr:TonB family protein [Rhodoferax sp.]MDR3368764.1 TonB family protein [Rhodoferax sp.]
MKDLPEQPPVRRAHKEKLVRPIPQQAPTLPPIGPVPSDKVSVIAGTLQGTDTPSKPESRTSVVSRFSDTVAPGKPSPASDTQLPSSSAEYLNNPAPTYPFISLRLNEAGKVVIRVLIGKNGLALEGSVAQSSGYERLDQAALKAVLKWRYLPGTVGGQAQDMWFDVPINFKPPT